MQKSSLMSFITISLICWCLLVPAFAGNTCPGDSKWIRYEMNPSCDAKGQILKDNCRGKTAPHSRDFVTGECCLANSGLVCCTHCNEPTHQGGQDHPGGQHQGGQGGPGHQVVVHHG